MIRQLTISAVLMKICCVGIFAATSASDPLDTVVQRFFEVRKRAYCPRAEAPPTIDGVLDDVCWQRAIPLKNFVIPGKALPSVEKDQALLTYDARNLYLAVRCTETESLGNSLKSSSKERDGNIWEDDCVEVFIAPQENARPYFQLIVNASGSCFDSKDKRAGWNGDWAAKTRTYPGHWELEVAIPFDTLSGEARDLAGFENLLGRHADLPEAEGAKKFLRAVKQHEKIQRGDIWRLNICRENYVGKSIFEYCEWSCTMKGFHDPENFGYLVFSPIPSCIVRDVSVNDMKGRKIFKTTLENKGKELQSVCLEIAIRKPDGAVSKIRKTRRIPGGEKTKVDLANRLTETGRHEVTVTALDTKSGKVLDRREFFLDLTIPLRSVLEQAEYYVTEKVARLNIEVNESSCRELAVSIAKVDDGKTVFKTHLSPNKKQCYLLPIEQLPLGDYFVDVELSSQGKETVKTRSRFKIVKDVFEEL